MTPDRDDPILDAMLEEVLGGRTPPDLSARIMQSLAIRGGASPMQRPEVNAYVEPAAPPLPLRAVVPPAISAASAHSSNGSSNGHVQLAVNSNSSRSRK